MGKVLRVSFLDSMFPKPQLDAIIDVDFLISVLIPESGGSSVGVHVPVFRVL